MIRHGFPPFLECSSKGDIRFSAFHARLHSFGNRSIEEIYQGAKIFNDGTTYLSPRLAKGRHSINYSLCSTLYSFLWKQYIVENPDLHIVLKENAGLSDQFGQQGHCCQATELWTIRQMPLIARILK